jgi:hypothetical protein
MGNSPNSGNSLIRSVITRLESRLPAGWTIVQVASDARRATVAPGKPVQFEIRGPGRTRGSVLVVARARLEPREVDVLALTRRPAPNEPVLVVAPHLSARARERLTARGFAYADPTGNVRLSLTTPALLIDTTGATENPEPLARERSSLKGAKAGRLVRTLCDGRPPLGLRELARRADVDAGYASRVVDLLDRDALITRAARGPITNVDWPALLRRWAQDYSPFQRPGATWYLAPRGLGAVTEDLKALRLRYAISGSWAATQFAPVAPTRLLMCYADDVPALARDLDLRPAETGANVVLVVPRDPIVYERTLQKRGLTIAALSQVAVDLLTSPGRGPSEAETLMDWMHDHESVWRDIEEADPRS